MKPTHLFALATFALAACGQPATTEEAARAAPQGLKEQVEAMPAEERGVFAMQQLTAYLGAHPEMQPPCTSIRRVDAVGDIPADARPDTLYAGYIGSLIYTVQCGEQRTEVGDDPRQHWLVAFAPGASEITVANCSDEEGRRSRCMRVPLRTIAETAPAATPPATP